MSKERIDRLFLSVPSKKVLLTIVQILVQLELYFFLSPTIGFGSIPVLNELHLVSSGSKSYLISGGDSCYSWVFIRALDLWEGRSN